VDVRATRRAGHAGAAHPAEAELPARPDAR